MAQPAFSAAGYDPGPPPFAWGDLGAHERTIIDALAAYQLRYGRPEEALTLLTMSHALWPQERRTLQLLIQSLVQLGEWEAAERASARLRSLIAPMPTSPRDRIREALIHFGRGRLAQARAVLESCLSRRSETGAV